MEVVKNTFRYVAIVNPFTKTVHVRSDKYPMSYALYKHEQQHVIQIERHEKRLWVFGRITFTVWYLLLLIRYGYSNHPYEVEAKNAEWR